MRRQSPENLNLSFPQLASIPQKEEWAIINKYKALQFERMKKKEQEIDRLKKQQFRRQLDQQLNSRSNAEQEEKERDRRYYQELSQKSEEQRIKEEQLKFEKYSQRRRVDSENIHKLEEGHRNKIRDGDTGYHLEIGEKSEIEHRIKSDNFRKEMIDTLDLQLKQKTEQQKMSKIRNLQMEQEHKRMQENYFKPENRRQYSQNQKIYDYYQNIDRERMFKQKQIQEKIVDEAVRKQYQAEVEKELQEKTKKQHNKEIVKETLGQQLKELHRKRVQEKFTNPEEVSYGFMSSVFEPKYQGYNKAQYKKELERQAEEQKLKKIKDNHMSEQEYRFNLNQLSKAVMGDYAQQQYLDRSLGAIGNHEKYGLEGLTLGNEDKDVDVIKSRLKNMRNKANFSTIQ